MHRWLYVEGDYDAAFGRDISHDIAVRRVSWRWLFARLTHVLSGDTVTARLYAQDHRLTPTQTPTRKPLTPTQFGDWLSRQANT